MCNRILRLWWKPHNEAGSQCKGKRLFLEVRMRYIFIILFSIQCLTLFSQDFNTNLDKYHHYRNRLVTEFMVVGDDQGMSMPAERRDTAAHFLKWSDNTIWLGWYVGVLALEYHLLTQPHYYGYSGGDTTAVDRTLDELYYAMRGVIR